MYNLKGWQGIRMFGLEEVDGKLEGKTVRQGLGWGTGTGKRGQGYTTQVAER